MEDNYDELAHQLLMEQEYYEEMIRITYEAMMQVHNSNYSNYVNEEDLPF